jgi:sodium-dependent dicarboxylate transporter 2/3/5
MTKTELDVSLRCRCCSGWAVMLPRVKAFLLGVPIAATTGGMGTIIGSPPNAIAAGALVNTAHLVDFITWIIYGVPVSLSLTLLSWWVLVRLFMKNEVRLSLEDLVPVKHEITQDFRLKRWTAIGIRPSSLCGYC